eukprot:Skav232221  [mRNA]  locus=scaffold2626:548598:549365:+ [translate_table: standard]
MAETRPSSEAVLVTLHVLTPSGESIEVTSSHGDTILMLKKRLQSSEDLPENFRSAPGNALRLISGAEVLRDDVRISETGLGDGDQLSLIVSFTPQGAYKHSSGLFESGPAGDDTLADIKADFGDDGTFKITMNEGLILPGEDFDAETFEDKEPDPSFDPYAAGQAWDHRYQGTVQMDGSSDFRMFINTLERKGVFHHEMCCTELRGKIDPGCNQVSLCLPFAACNQASRFIPCAGSYRESHWLWVSLKRQEERAP